MAKVNFYDESDTKLCELGCEVADDEISRYIGLSNHDYLENKGMLFLYEKEGDRSFVMRDMNFDLDIIFADKDGFITEVHSADAPESDVQERSLTRYSGSAQAVVEVPKGFAEEYNIEPEKSRLEVEIVEN